MDNDNDTGYGGWKYIPMDAEESMQAMIVQILVAKQLKDAGYPASVVENLTVTFKKATLTISPEEARSGAWHGLADGQPFMRMEIAAKGKTFEDIATDPTAQTVFYMMQMLKGGSMTIGGPLVIAHDYRGSPAAVKRDLMLMIDTIKPHIVKNGGQNPSAPKPN